MFDVRRKLLVALLAIVPVARIVATYPVFSQTIDEPVHIGAGFEWLTTPYGSAFDPEHPPLARALFGLDTWLHGVRLAPRAGDLRVDVGNALLYRDAHYVRNLAAARAGNLPFFLLALAAVGLWTRRLFGDVEALVAMALFGTLPPILAHAGLATTDMAVTAFVALALYALATWLDAPTWPRTLLLGTTVGLGLLTKFSFALYFALGALVVLLFARKKMPSRLLAAALLAALLVWAGYKFDVGTLAEARQTTYPPSAHVTSGALAHIPIPAPYFFAGLEFVRWHAQQGHPAFLLGDVSDTGWWYYFPVVWFFKSPLPFVLLSLGGVAWLLGRRKNREAAAVALAPLVMLLPTMTGGIDIGIRHILPLYPFLTIAAAHALVALWRRRRVAAVVLAGWLAIETTLAHPDYLAWFNELAGSHPERIANDSNLDWGQDLLRLANVAQREHLTPLYLAYFGSADPHRHLAEFAPLPPNTPVHGWVAISEMNLALNPDLFGWLETREPVGRVGKSIRLYRIP